MFQVVSYWFFNSSGFFCSPD